MTTKNDYQNCQIPTLAPHNYPQGVVGGHDIDRCINPVKFTAMTVYHFVILVASVNVKRACTNVKNTEVHQVKILSCECPEM